MTRSLFVPLHLLILVVVAWFGSPVAVGQANNSGGIAPAPASAPSGAVDGGGNPSQGGQQRTAPSGGMGPEILLIMGGFLVLMIVMSTMAGRKEKKRRSEMMSSLRRHDKVLVGGGMIGTIVELKDDEVVVKVDEATNTRIRFTKNSIQSVLKQSSAEESPAESVEA